MRENDYVLRMKVGIWNVRTMIQSGKVAEIADELLKYNSDITALQEIRWKVYGRIKKPRYILLYSGAETQGEHGVGFIIKRSLEYSIIDFEPINSRLCKTRIKGKFYNTTIVNVYAATESAKEERKERFYEDMNRCCDQIPKHDKLLVLVEFNAKIGKVKANQSVARQHTIHEETSENGLILYHFAEANKLLISSTCFEHKDIHNGTWKDPAGRTVNQIDHVLINKRRSIIVEDVQTMRGTNCDYFLILTIIRHKISRTYQKKQTYKLR
jgi:exonuclease III